MERAEIEQRLRVFEETVACCHALHLSVCDRSLAPLQETAASETTANLWFSLSQCKTELMHMMEESDQPILFTNEITLMWLCFPEGDEKSTLRLRLLGPFFIDDYSTHDADRMLREAGIESEQKAKALAYLRAVPILAWTRVLEYAIMVHFLMTGKRISFSELRFLESRQTTRKTSKSGEPRPNVHGTYAAEQEMLRMVREGDLNLMQQISRISMTGSVGRLAESGNTMRHMKNSVLVCTTLFSRAAIEGGLSAETAYSLCDRYFQGVEMAHSLSDLKTVTMAMQRDFVERVHAVRVSALSREIEAACSYIAEHLEDELALAEIAKSVGYMDYYFSKKFKSETGVSPTAYIRQKRLEKAAVLLQTTDMDVQDIAYRLHFCSQSYFTDCFRKAYGVSPSQYRKDGAP